MVSESKKTYANTWLKGWALQEWRLLSQAVQQEYMAAVQALRSRLDPSSKTIASQNFRNSLLKSGGSASDFTDQIVYGKDDLSHATIYTLLYG